MESTRTCPNGHRYRADLPECPFCPKTDPNARTVVDSDLPAKGSVSANQAAADRPTRVDETAPSPKSSGRAERTVIMQPEGGGAPANSSPSGQGKLVGWLVTFTWNPLGDDYRLREGKTLIGAAGNMDIVLPDGMVSGEHAQLLYRSGELKIRDNFSTNGTLVNGEDVGDTPRTLKNGDEITVGRTVFKLRLIE